MSLFLDAVRLVAAMTVFMGHFAFQRISGSFMWPINVYSHEAVTVFFVLSGFVIAYATEVKENGLPDYCVSRLARMYSVVLPAILLTVALDEIGNYLHPALYASWNWTSDLSFLRFFTALTFTNMLWSVDVRQGTNAAYWSMGYEVPYYVIFGIMTFCRSRWRYAYLIIAFVVVGPSIALAMFMWYAGVIAFQICKRDLISPKTGGYLFFGSILAWCIYEIIAWRVGRLIFPNSLNIRQEIIQDYFVATFFMGILIGFNAAAAKYGGMLVKFSTEIRWAAGASFSIYLCHLPIMHFLVALLPWSVSDWRSRSVILLGTLFIIFLFAELTERKKKPWHRFFGRFWNLPSRKTSSA